MKGFITSIESTSIPKTVNVGIRLVDLTEEEFEKLKELMMSKEYSSVEFLLILPEEL